MVFDGGQPIAMHIDECVQGVDEGNGNGNVSSKSIAQQGGHFVLQTLEMSHHGFHSNRLAISCAARTRLAV